MIAYLPTTGYECFCLVKIYSTIIVKATVVRLRVVYMGTFIPRTDAIVTSFHHKNYKYPSSEGNSYIMSSKKCERLSILYLPYKANRILQEEEYEPTS